MTGSTPSSAIDGPSLLAFMKSRRVTRDFTDAPIPDEILAAIAAAGRWATSGGNGYPNQFLIVRDPERIELVRAASPGMIPVPPALILIGIDTEKAERFSMHVEPETMHWVDVGTAAMNMMNVAHAYGIGSCPVTSFSKGGVATMLDLPPTIDPVFILILGYPAPSIRVRNPNAPRPLTARDITSWERIGNHEPA